MNSAKVKAPQEKQTTLTPKPGPLAGLSDRSISGSAVPPVVCIGMSSGGIAPLKTLFRQLSPDTGMAFVVIHHIHNLPTRLPEILRSCTTMPVYLPIASKLVNSDSVYVLPPGKEITLADGCFSLGPRSKTGGWSNVVSVFLNSLAKSGHRGIAVILSGLDEDGAAALKAFKERGGITIVQEPQTAERQEMPLAAIDTGFVDHVLPPPAIAGQLEKIAWRFRGSGGSLPQAGSHNPTTASLIQDRTVSPNALKVLDARYLRRDSRGTVVETPDQLFVRVSSAIAEAEREWGGQGASREWAERFHRMLHALDFLPNSPTLMNAGTDLGQLSACFVLPIEDSLENIFDSLRLMALIQRTGGGTGFSFSRLRPEGDIIASTGGQSSGPVAFMHIFDCATERIRLGGKRRGANMAVLRVDHPDIIEFIRAKRQPGVLENFNISVGVTDTFMEAARLGDSYNLVNPRLRRTTGQLNAREVFAEIVESAWQTGDPGLLFLNTINAANPTPGVGVIETTNPCGEVPLLPFESCNLGSINLSHMVKAASNGKSIDWEGLRAIVTVAVRFLDDVIEMNRYPDPRLEDMARGNRKIGLGVMGFADLLIQLGVSYASCEALQIGSQLIRVIAEEARAASRSLAEERGVFPNYERSVYDARRERLRNATLLSIAPTGTLSILAGTSASIEPLFALAYRRTHALSGKPLREVHPLFLSYLERHRLRSDQLLSEVLAKGRLAEVRGLPNEVKQLFISALEITPEQHVAMQAAFQAHIDNSVSKTVNLPQGASKETVALVYRMAWEQKLKGITVFRYGSKGTQVLELGAGEDSYEREHFAVCDPHECRL